MREGRHLAPSEDESFGPGTDLVLSLFACLLMITLLGAVARKTETPPPSAPTRQQLYEFRERDRQAPFFARNDEVLTEEAKGELRRIAPGLQAGLEGGRFNHLQLLGFASPETREGRELERERWNFALSLHRAQAVADFLYQQRIPYECMSLSAFGRSQSKVLSGWLAAFDGRSLATWDAAGQDSPEVDEQAMASERRVEIWGIEHPDSVCHRVLSSRLR